MTDCKSNIVKGAGLIICGLLIGFVPNIVSVIFYFFGLLIIVLCAVRLIKAIANGTFDVMFAGCIFGALTGVIVMSLPHFVKVQVPLIIGIILTVTGASKLIRTLSADVQKKTAGIISAAFLVISGLFFMINPLKISGAFRIAIGLAVALIGVFHLYGAYRLKKQNDNIQPDVVNIDSFSVNDDE